MYRAFQPAVGREVAIRVIPSALADDPGFIRRFEGDARLVAALEHPHVVPLYDFWREPGAAYLVTRLTHGGTLADVVARSALPEADAAGVLGQVAGALRAAHDGGVVHGAIGPEQVALDADGNAYLAGLGLRAAATAAHAVGPTTAPEVIDGSPPTPASDVYALGVVVAQCLTGLTGRIEQVEGALPRSVAAVVASATNPDPARRPSAIDFAMAFATATQPGAATAPLPDVEVENPYRGLAAFAAADAAVFLGRQRVVDRLVARLGQPGAAGQIIALVGPSGSGKSSVVQAGLLPALADNALPGSAQWFVTSAVPGRQPFEALEAALLRVAIDPPPTLYEQLSSGENGLRRAVRRVLPDDGSQLLLVVDQFEELFTLTDPQEAAAFLDALAGAVADAHSRVRVVATLRADFYDRPLQHRRFGELLREGTEVITPMSPEELEQAISGPAEPLGVHFAPAVVADIVHEVEGRPGALPLLQYALTELFEARAGSIITSETYRQIGGVTGALALRAEALFAECDEREQLAARQVFLRLVTLGEGALDTRRRVLVSELDDLPLHPLAVRAVLDRFSAHRLLTFDRDPVTRGPTVEISHEALLTEWDRLQGWIDGAREDVRNQRRLADAMGEWAGSGRRDDLLLSGGRLARFTAWAADADVQLASGERGFLDASIELAERAERLELERESQRVAAQRQARQRLRLTAVAGVAAVIVGALAVVAFLQRQAAQGSERQVTATLRANDLATSSRLVLRDDVRLALRLAIESAGATTEFGVVTPEAMDALHWAVQEANIVYPAGDTTPVAVRPGPRSLTGVYALPPNELIALAQSGPVGSYLGDQCPTYLGTEECPDPLRSFPAGLSIAGGDEAYGVVQPKPGTLTGAKVELVSDFTVSNEDLASELRSLEGLTGIVVSHRAAPVWDELSSRKDANDPFPDLIMGGYPTQLADWRSDGLIDLSSYLDMSRIRSDFGANQVKLGSIDGGYYMLPVASDMKGMVYYPKAAFEAAGYRVPQTWDELLALSRQMVADGRTPWCFAWEDGGGSGWPGTDLLETLVLRVGGTDAYDAWIAHTIPFDAPVIRQAGQMASTLLLSDGFVRGGAGAISSTPVFDSLAPLLEDEPGCWMVLQSSLMLTTRPDVNSVAGRSLDWFPFPPIERGSDVMPQYGGSSYVLAFNDRPEVRAFISHVASPQWGRVWAATATTFVSLNDRFDVRQYGGAVSAAPAGVLRSIGEAAREAIAAGVWRYDASDLMPGAIGLYDDNGNPGAFFTGMLDVVDGRRTMDQMLTDVEAKWQSLGG